jgi:hypothetical protein
VLSLPSKSARAFPTTIAVAGLLVAVAHTWTLLLIPASPAAALVLLGPFGRKATRAENKRLAMCLVIFAVAGLACLKAAIMLLTTVDVSFLVSAFGGLNGTSPYPLFVLIIVSIYLCFSSPAWFDRRGIVDGRRTAQRIRLAVACPALGVTLGAVIFVAQMRTLGTTSYYLLKYLMGVELILALLVAAVAAFLVGSVTQRRAAPQSMAAAVCATLAASQFFGVIPGRTGLLLSETDDGTASVASPYDRAAMAEGIVRAAGSRPEGPSFGRDYFAVGPGRAAEAFYTDGWFHAVDASLSNAVMDRVNLLRVSVDDQDGATAALRLLLAHEGKPEVVVAPRELVRLRRSLPDGAPSSRVVSWNSKQAPVAP